jgi:hypothetical protein
MTLLLLQTNKKLPPLPWFDGIISSLKMEEMEVRFKVVPVLFAAAPERWAGMLKTNIEEQAHQFSTGGE